MYQNLWDAAKTVLKVIFIAYILVLEKNKVLNQ